MKNLIITLLFASFIICGCKEPTRTWRVPDEALAWFPHQLGDTLFFADTSGSIEMGRIVQAEMQMSESRTLDYKYDANESFFGVIVFNDTTSNLYHLVECRFAAMYSDESKAVDYIVSYFVKSRQNFQTIEFSEHPSPYPNHEYFESFEVDGVSVPGVYSYDIAARRDFAARGADGADIAKIFAAPGYGLLRVEFWDGYWMERRWR